MHAAGAPVASITPGAACFTLRINGTPKPKGRPRGRVVGSGKKAFASFYTDETTREWEAEVVRQVRAQLPSSAPVPLRDRILVTVRFYLARPKSTSASVEFPVKNRTDVDNLAKAILDAIQTPRDGSWPGVIANDNLITDLVVAKRYADDLHPEGVELEVTGKL